MRQHELMTDEELSSLSPETARMVEELAGIKGRP